MKFPNILLQDVGGICQHFIEQPPSRQEFLTRVTIP